MTVSSATNKSGPYLGNGVTVAFDYEFRILNETHLTVVITEDGVDATASPSEYTVSGVGAAPGGAVTFSVAPATGRLITIIRNAPFTQPVDLENQGAYYAETVEDALDLAAMRDQQLAEGLSRAVQIPVGAGTGVLDSLIGNIVRLGESADEIDTVAGIAADVPTVAGISANVTTVAGIAPNVVTVAGIAPDVTAVKNIAANVTTVAGIAADVSEVISISAEVEAVAAVAAGVATVAAIDTEVATVAGLAADIPGIPANVTAAQLAETNAQKWAANPEDSVVSGGLFSALHYAAKAAASLAAIVNGMAGWIHGATNKATPTGADEIGIADSADTWSLKRLSLTNLAAWLASLTQTLANKTLTSPAINTPTLTLKQSAAPVPTAEGDIQWGTDDNVLAIGDGAATKLFVPIPASSTAGDIEYFTGAKVKARLAKGTASQVLTMNAGATAPEWATPAFAKPMYESGLSAITSAGTLTLAHDLGGIPTFIFPYFICVTASQGYAVGDIIPMNPARFVIVPDATNLFIRFENTTASYSYYNKTTGAYGNLVAASWNFGVRAGL